MVYQTSGTISIAAEFFVVVTEVLLFIITYELGKMKEN